MGVKRKDDLVRWKERCPIRRLGNALVTAGVVTAGHIADMREEARAEVDAAWQAAERDPFPPAEDLLGIVYAGKRR